MLQIYPTALDNRDRTTIGEETEPCLRGIEGVCDWWFCRVGGSAREEVLGCTTERKAPKRNVRLHGSEAR